MSLHQNILNVFNYLFNIFDELSVGPLKPVNMSRVWYEHDPLFKTVHRGKSNLQFCFQKINVSKLIPTGNLDVFKHSSVLETRMDLEGLEIE